MGAAGQLRNARSHTKVVCFGEFGKLSVRELCFIRILRAGQDP